MLIDWHAHHTPVELAERIGGLGQRTPKLDAEDSPDFAKRVREMDAAGIDLQIVSQGAGLNADGLPPEVAIELVRVSNDLVAERSAPYADRVAGSVAVTYQDVTGSVDEIERNAGRGFAAVMLYANGPLIGQAEVEPLFAKIHEAKLPIFLHGGGAGVSRPPGLDALEDNGMGVVVSATSDAAVSDCVVRMIAAGLFDRYPGLRIVIRSGGGGVPLLQSKLWWKHKSPGGAERQYVDILRDHFLIDTASVTPRGLAGLVLIMGEDRIVFGSDYCGGLGPLSKAMPVLDEQDDPAAMRAMVERNAQALFGK